MKKGKISGKEQAKLNKRKKFYEKFNRLIGEDLILISMNRGISFPEYDELSKIFQEDYSKNESEINFEEIKSIEIVYLEEAHFLLNASKSKHLKIIRRETTVDNEGTDRRGQSGADDSFNYQAAYNWGVQVIDKKGVLILLEKEMENPSEYDLTPKVAKIQEPVYRKTRRFVRKRKR
ncbi:MAG: hypothetical protein ACXAB7_19510 [Candidatus Kariarchaeaceae archaeon]